MAKEMKISSMDIESLLTDQKSLSALSLEVERVLRFYEEHPNYPLDIAKLRAKVMEVYATVNKSITDLQKLQTDDDVKK
ncbi:MAG: hypothetical protein HYV29_14970 [Ignavibacteriales bacterium]|nr:hypothetical protein [Ignavibacteriales bacterium]